MFSRLVTFPDMHFGNAKINVSAVDVMTLNIRVFAAVCIRQRSFLVVEVASSPCHMPAFLPDCSGSQLRSYLQPRKLSPFESVS
jgi:hypothetical protein